MAIIYKEFRAHLHNLIGALHLEPVQAGGEERSLIDPHGKVRRRIAITFSGASEESWPAVISGELLCRLPVLLISPAVDVADYV
jgi:hypothetical protein